jgi:hypothetical protein
MRTITTIGCSLTINTDGTCVTVKDLEGGVYYINQDAARAILDCQELKNLADTGDARFELLTGDESSEELCLRMPDDIYADYELMRRHFGWYVTGLHRYETIWSNKDDDVLETWAEIHRHMTKDEVFDNVAREKITEYLEERTEEITLGLCIGDKYYYISCGAPWWAKKLWLEMVTEQL